MDWQKLNSAFTWCLCPALCSISQNGGGTSAGVGLCNSSQQATRISAVLLQDNYPKPFTWLLCTVKANNTLAFVKTRANGQTVISSIFLAILYPVGLPSSISRNAADIGAVVTGWISC